MVLCEFTMSPLGKGESLSEDVARVLRIVDESGLKYKLTSMSTIIEGKYDDVMKVIADCHKELEKDTSRISTSLRLDYRQGDESRINSKVETLEKMLGKNLQRTG